jgi:hypothetical protein
LPLAEDLGGFGSDVKGEEERSSREGRAVGLGERRKSAMMADQ